MKIVEHESLTRYTTLKTGGVARYMARVENVVELAEAVLFANDTGLPHVVLGTGSNVLMSDVEFPGLVILMALKGRHFASHVDGTVTLTCQAGEELDQVIAETVEKGLWGLENLSAIPGTVGATPVQNVGAYGVEVGDCITAVSTYHIPSGTEKIFSRNECNFGYRNSFFKTKIGQEYIITAVDFLLHAQAQPKIIYADLAKYFLTHEVSLLAVREAVIKIRAEKFPDWRTLGTAGSFFKNPIITKAQGEELRSAYSELPIYEAGDNLVKVPLGYILDKVCNLKGFRVGNVGLYEAQALVLVNYGDATATEVKKFATLIADKVYAATAIIIEPEVRFVGE